MPPLPPRPGSTVGYQSLLHKQVGGEETEAKVTFSVTKFLPAMLAVGLVVGGVFAFKSFFTPDKPKVFIGMSHGGELEFPIEKLANSGPEIFDQRLLLIAKYGKRFEPDEGFERFQAISATGVTLLVYVAPEHAKILASLKPGQTFGAFGRIENKGLGYTPKPALVVK